LTLGECAVAYLSQTIKIGTSSDPLKPSSIAYRQRSVTMLRQNCAGFDRRMATDFTMQDCEMLCDRLRKKYSTRRFNGALWALRGVLEVARKSKVIKENLAKEIPPAKIVDRGWKNFPGKRRLPDEEKIELVMDYLRRHQQLQRNGRTGGPPPGFNAFLFCEMMAESSQRPGSIPLLRPKHVNFKHSTVDWVPFKHSPDTTTLPMTRRMKAIFRLLLRRHPGGDEPLFPIKSPARALRRACEHFGIKPHLTPHSFRHLWSTRMAHANVAPALAAEMRRDKDGGTMFLRTYVHSRPDKLREVVKVLEQRAFSSR
jgi:integrase